MVYLFSAETVKVRMTTEKVPNWLSEIIESGDPAESGSSRRGGSRPTWTGPCFVELDEEADSGRFLARGLNACPTGVGFITRNELKFDQPLKLYPREGAGEPVHLRVVHCTRTVQGYKVGCAIA